MKKIITVLMVLSLLLVSCGDKAENVNESGKVTEVENQKTEEEIKREMEEKKKADQQRFKEYVEAMKRADEERKKEEAFKELSSVNYKENISKPYDDVDYQPFLKETNFLMNPRVDVKAIYLTENTAAGSRMDDLIQMINETELNAVVIDVKNDSGNLLFYSKAAEKTVPKGNKHTYIKDMKAFMKKLKDNNIYTIARIVTFKSPLYAQQYPERAITYRGSNKVYYADGAYWASPFDEKLWDYNIEIAKEAIAYGFNEIQFDYVRFPAIKASTLKKLDLKNPLDSSMTYGVQSFVKKAYKEINSRGVYVALDVFGWTATAVDDTGIGQHWEGMSNVCDYICPMDYPSHYGYNNFGFKVPDAEPYGTVLASLKDSIKRNANIGTPANIRPWLQAFTATWVKGHIPYNKKEIQDQIRACKELGINEYMFWNSSNKYPQKWFNKE